MICREKPKNVDNYYIVNNKDLVHHLMNKGVYPLYFYDNVYYFIKDDKCPNKKFRGSANQRIIDIKKTLETGIIQLSTMF